MAAELVAAAHSHPLLSGFYRMMTAVMRTASRAGLLSDAEPGAGQICRQVPPPLSVNTRTQHMKYRPRILCASLAARAILEPFCGQRFCKPHVSCTSVSNLHMKALCDM